MNTKQYAKQENAVNVGKEVDDSFKVNFQKGKNLYDLSRQCGGYIDTTGGVVTNNITLDEGYLRYIPVKSETTYTFSIIETTIVTQQQWIGIAEYSDTNESSFIQNAIRAIQNVPCTFTTSATTKYLCVSARNLLQATKVQLEEGDTSTSWEPYVIPSININNEEIFNEKNSLKVSLNDPESTEKVWIQKSKNLFNPVKLNKGIPIAYHGISSVTISNDEFTFVANDVDMYFGQVSLQGAEYKINNGILIPVKPGETYQFYLTNSAFNSNFITKYDIDKTSLGFTVIHANNGSLIIPANCYYISFRFGINPATSGTTYKTKVMLAKQTAPITEYVSYSPTTINVLGDEIYDYENTTQDIIACTDYTYLKGLKICYGKVSTGTIAANAGVDKTVSFPLSFKTQTYTVIASIESGDAYWSNLAITAAPTNYTSCKISAWNNGGNSTSANISYIAIGL